MTQFISVPLVAIPQPPQPWVLAQATVNNGSLIPSGEPIRVQSQVPQTQFPNIQTEYRVQITIGTPAQPFNVLLDTGSFDLWIFGSNCSDCGVIENSYDVNSSLTGLDLGVKTGTTMYADGGKYSGKRVKDIVKLGSLVVPDFQFTQVDTFSAPWGSQDADGVMGMGFHPRGMDPAAPSFAEELITRKILKDGIFSYFIQADEFAGTVAIGGYNSAFFQNSSKTPTWIPYMQDDTLTSGKIAIPLVSVLINSTIVEKFTSHASQLDGRSEGNSGSAILDTGSSQAIVSHEIVDALATALNETTANGAVFPIYYNAEHTQYTYAVPCELKSESGGSPIVTLTFAGGLTLSITALEYVSKPQSGRDYCQIMMLAVDGGYSQGTYLLGNTFLKRYVTVFDFVNQRVGFALGVKRDPKYSLGVNGAAAGVVYTPISVETGGGGGSNASRSVAIVVCSCLAVILAVGLVIVYERRRKAKAAQQV
ncbi:aspartic peptidase domain-containing protein [Obelidium mucronatum]|nr:aspartic peptidase domain-containing protein [Obelidium mucronatum]